MSGVQSIERAFALLRALAVGPTGVTELAERVELPKSTVARLLAALEREGAVQQVEAGGEYRLGSGLVDLAGHTAPGRNLVASARPHLIELTSASGETSGISVLDGDRVYYLDHVDSGTDVQVRDWTGEHAPWHSVPSGVAIIAHLHPTRADELLAGTLERCTTATVTDPARLRARLGQARSAGYTWGYGEFAEGINSVAAAVLDRKGRPVAALHVHGPAYRFPDPDETHDLGLLVVDAARRLASQL